MKEYMICDEMLTTLHRVMEDLKEIEKQEIVQEYRRTYMTYKKSRVVNPHDPVVVQLLQEINEKSEVRLSYYSFVQSCKKLTEDKIKLPEAESVVKYGTHTLVTRKRPALPSAPLAASPPPSPNPDALPLCASWIIRSFTRSALPSNKMPLTSAGGLPLRPPTREKSPPNPWT